MNYNFPVMSRSGVFSPCVRDSVTTVTEKQYVIKLQLLIKMLVITMELHPDIFSWLRSLNVTLILLLCIFSPGEECFHFLFLWAYFWTAQVSKAVKQI